MARLQESVFIVVMAFLSACGGMAPAPPASPAGQPLRLSDLPAIDANAVLAHVKTLSSDEYGGRLPGSKGEDLTVSYLEDQLKKMGIGPGNPDGSYVQKVPLVGITPDPNVAVTIKKGGRQAMSLKYKDEAIVWTKRVAETAAVQDSELVFVGYGVEAPEYNWDDYKGADLKGKTLVMLINDPAVPDPADPSKLDPKTFGGDAMTYYGRWTYKYETGARKGAAGVLIIHETGPAGYPFAVVQGNVGEQFDLVSPDKNMGRAAVEGWLALDTAKALLSRGGQDFDALKARARTREFTPVPLGLTASVELHNTLRTIESKNVVAKIDGADPKLKDEYVVYTAHWDHLGTDTSVTGDQIFNGARDNASGTGGILEVARGFKRLASPPRRSIVFLFVTAEEQGLLGSRYYSVNPLYPLARTLANINVDTLNVWGPTRDITVIGLGNSDLDDYTIEAAKEQGRTVRSDPEPEKGFYYRSDHFNFAKQGVPALDPHDGIDYVGKPDGYGLEIHRAYTANDYHKPSDEVKPDWDLRGAVEDLQLLTAVGYRVANADRYPEWKPGTEFKAIREEQLKRARTGTAH
jgi:Zn-dependent M28 family amino/carboxypeptidase